jgi:hypothetical protein
MQLDHGLYAPFIIDDPADPGDYDAEWILVLDDWTDGIGPSPMEIMDRLIADGESGSGGMGDMHDMGGMGGMGGMDAGDVEYRVPGQRAPVRSDTRARGPGACGSPTPRLTPFSSGPGGHDHGDPHRRLRCRPGNHAASAWRR